MTKLEERADLVKRGIGLGLPFSERVTLRVTVDQLLAVAEAAQRNLNALELSADFYGSRCDLRHALAPLLEPVGEPK